MSSSKILAEGARARAEARFQVTEQRKTEADKAMQDLREAKAAEAAKTTRLRALRLAKEESDRQAALAAPPKPVSRRKTAAARATPA